MGVDIKLNQLFSFPDGKTHPDKNFSGIWETTEVTSLHDPSKTRWRLVRRLSVDTEAPVGESLSLPPKVIELFAYRVDRKALVGTPLSNKK